MQNIDTSWKWFYKISGLSQLVAAIFFSIGFVLTSCQTIALGPTVERLEILAKEQILFQLSNASFILADIFAILGMVGIFLSLYNLQKNRALAGAVLSILGATIAAGVRFGVYAEGVIANLYISTTNMSEQISYVAVAELAKNATDSGLLIANILLGAGGLITGIAMLTGVFNRKVAIFFFVTNILYLVGFFGVVVSHVFFPVILLACLMAIISMVLIGIRLYKIGNEEFV